MITCPRCKSKGEFEGGERTNRNAAGVKFSFARVKCSGQECGLFISDVSLADVERIAREFEAA
jgi:hypothetical protein